MRSFVVLLLLILSGCASQSHTSSYNGSDNFDREAAAKTRISLGLTYLQNGNYSQAKFNLDKALEFAPEMADSHYSLGYYYQLVGENQRADAAYQRAIELAPDNADISNAYAAFLCQTGDYPNARAYFLKAINSENYASTAATYENLALCSQSQGQLDDALTYMESAVKHSPSRAKSLYLLAELQAANGHYQAARTTLRRYERVAPVSAESLWLTAEIEDGLGNDEASRGYGALLVQNYPDHPNARRYLDRHRGDAAQVIADSGRGPVNTQPAPAKIEQGSATTAPTKQKLSVSPEANLDSEPQPVYHVVQDGENLYRVSLQYNIRMQRLIEWNDLSEASALYVGKKIWLVDPSTIE